MDLEKTLVSAVRDVFETMVMMPVAPGPALAEKIATFHDHVSGLLGLSGDLKGALCIHCPEEIARAVTGTLLGMEVEEVDEDVKDAIGEMANMIAGGIKTTLEAEGKSMELAIPTAIAGRSYTLNSLARADSLIIPFALGEGSFLVELKFMQTA